MSTNFGKIVVNGTDFSVPSIIEGGAGGHTIINENGTSMTARNGLQFVGGANISDDNINNRTIVDIASAGGINGVFPDLSNDLGITFTFDDAQHTWEATEDCVIGWSLIAIDSGTAAFVHISDGINNLRVFNSYEYQHGAGGWALVKKGQIVTYRAKASTTGGGFISAMTVYGIQTGTTHSKFQPIIYSLEEREIGVWTNGKPLYEKTFVIDTITDGITYVDSVITSDMEIKHTKGFYIFKSDGTVAPNPHRSGDSRYQCILSSLGYSNGHGYIDMVLGDGRIGAFSGVFTIRYIKTTDTPGSGTWTPQGVPAVHYSTDEQVIGTWIDGSTIYEKVIDVGSDVQVSSSQWTESSITILNLNKIIEAKSTNDGGTLYPLMATHTNGAIRLLACRDGNPAFLRWLILQYTKTTD